jgi:hypothetical protein
MTRNDNSTTRRTVIAGLLAAPAATALAAFPAGAVADGESLSAKIAAHGRAMAAQSAFDRNECGGVAARLRAAQAAWQKACDAIPHYTCKTGFKAVTSGSRLFFMTTEGSHAALARKALGATDPDRESDYYEACRELVAADDARKEEIGRLAKVHRLGELEAEWAAINKRSTALGKLTYAAEEAVLQHRTASIAEMAAKLAFVVEEEADAEDVLPLLLADARRLARKEAS